jgi:hypothetical protein
VSNEEVEDIEYVDYDVLDYYIEANFNNDDIIDDVFIANPFNDFDPKV